VPILFGLLFIDVMFASVLAASGDTARTAIARVATLRLREAAITFLSEDWFFIHPSFLG
jgi:hypothetical protein